MSDLDAIEAHIEEVIDADKDRQPLRLFVAEVRRLLREADELRYARDEAVNRANRDHAAAVKMLDGRDDARSEVQRLRAVLADEDAAVKAAAGRAGIDTEEHEDWILSAAAIIDQLARERNEARARLAEVEAQAAPCDRADLALATSDLVAREFEAANARLAEVEAQAADARGFAAWFLDLIASGIISPRGEEMARGILSGDVGRALLARVAKMDSVLREAREVLKGDSGEEHAELVRAIEEALKA